MLILIHTVISYIFFLSIELTWPLDLEEPQNTTVNEGEDAIFTCRPLNDPTATVKWVKRNQTGLQTSIGTTSDVSLATYLDRLIGRVMVLNANFNNISVILWWSVLLVEETRLAK